MSEPVFDVTEVVARLYGNEVLIEARGRTRTGGWCDARLHPVASSDPETLAFEFIAEPPEGTSTDDVPPITACYKTGPLAAPLPRQVTVFAETDQETTPIQQPYIDISAGGGIRPRL
jgi:hypothetical protein